VAQKEGALHFATVIAPDVPRAQGEAMVGVLQACFDEHNAGPQPERGRKKLAADMAQRQGRPWQLHVWQLQGAPENWDAQLAARAAQQPVFAVVGGVGGARWAPVHGFCERAGLPCLFPHLEAPAAEDGSFYALYLGQGALLEAGLVARQLAAADAPVQAVTQVLREGDAAAEAAALALRRALAEQGVAVQEVRMRAHEPLEARRFAGLQAQQALVLWLRPADLRGLQAAPPAGAQVFVSATLAGDDAVPLPAAWKARALMAYPFELPQQRERRMAQLRQWLQARQVAPGDERVQADAWVACRALRTAMLEAEDHLAQDYLVERLEVDMERSTATALYPRLALGIGQRFASKTGYLVRFDEATGRFTPVGERIAP
jgi:hypothetical protein